MEKFLTKSEKETQKLAQILASEILKTKKVYPERSRGAVVIGLEGNLGAGKTTFIQAFAKGIGIKKRLTSPTFVLMKKYNNLYHLDCYRIKDSQDVLALDFKEIISEPKNIVLIEWAEKVKRILPKNKIWIKFKILGKDQRLITFS
jgi:tRNA threonylcarbamoyladenosine biosynthesis protein TsaE